MAKILGPLMSLSASGSFANTLTFGKWKGIQYARIKAAPADPNSAGQQTQRTAFAAAVTGWQALEAGEKEDWTERAAELGLKMSGFNLYVKCHIDQEVVPPADPVMP